MLRRVDLVRTDISEELSASFIRVTRIGELGTTLAVTSNARCEKIPQILQIRHHSTILLIETITVSQLFKIYSAFNGRIGKLLKGF
jgi:hypothetical protein